MAFTTCSLGSAGCAKRPRELSSADHTKQTNKNKLNFLYKVSLLFFPCGGSKDPGNEVESTPDDVESNINIKLRSTPVYIIIEF